ncbi:MAG: MAPEG family protein [Alphaproteobacteria bacterium]
MIIMAKLTALVTVAMVFFTFYLGGRVGLLRGKTGVAAPATTGDPIFERAYRIHYNTIENLVLVLPLLWLAVGVVGDLWAGLAGMLWLLGRVVYAMAYMKDPEKRGPGMLMTMAAMIILAGIVTVGAVQGFLA